MSPFVFLLPSPSPRGWEASKIPSLRPLNKQMTAELPGVGKSRKQCPAGGVCIHPPVWVGGWPPGSSARVPQRQTQNCREPEREPEACPVHFDTLKLPSSGLPALMFFCFSLCSSAQVCPLPPMVSHGDYICHPRPCERYNHGTVVEFYCDPGYTLTNDYKYITCQYGEWFPSYQVYCVKTGKGAAMALLLSSYSPSFLEEICWSVEPGEHLFHG